MVDKAKGVTQSSPPIYKQHELKGKNFVDLYTNHIIKNKFRGTYVQTNSASKETITFHVATDICDAVI